MNARAIRSALRALLALLLLLPAAALAAESPVLSEAEIRRLLQAGPWPPPLLPDASNRVSGQPAAIALGAKLFFDPALSRDGSIACASCHRPDLHFADGRRKSRGLAELDRNSPSLLDVRFNRWFAWDGGSDSLWSHSLRPLFDAREMGADAAMVAARLRQDGDLACRYRAAFGRSAADEASEERLAVDAAKALAAYQETLLSAKSAFDRFRDGMAENQATAIAAYPAAALRGAKIFFGEGNCTACHFGPTFSNGEFADIGIRFFIAKGVVDPGRHGGIKRVKESRFNRLGPYSDDPDGRGALLTRQVTLQHKNWGEFKVPSLRNVGRTAPYMHDGSLADLGAVVDHYADLNEERIHADGERILKPLGLDVAARADLVAFLQSLDAEPLPFLQPAAIADCR